MKSKYEIHEKIFGNITVSLEEFVHAKKPKYGKQISFVITILKDGNILESQDFGDIDITLLETYAETYNVDTDEFVEFFTEALGWETDNEDPQNEALNDIANGTW